MSCILILKAPNQGSCHGRVCKEGIPLGQMGLINLSVILIFRSGWPPDSWDEILCGAYLYTSLDTQHNIVRASLRSLTW